MDIFLCQKTITIMDEQWRAMISRFNQNITYVALKIKTDFNLLRFIVKKWLTYLDRYFPQWSEKYFKFLNFSDIFSLFVFGVQNWTGNKKVSRKKLFVNLRSNKRHHILMKIILRSIQSTKNSLKMSLNKANCSNVLVP
jgi:hypothetical protein